MVGLLSLAHLMAFVDRFAMSAVSGPLKATFRLSETELGALQGLAFAIPYAVTVTLFGRLADRIGPRPMIVGGLLVWTAGAMACGFAQASFHLWFARMVMGVGQAAFIPAALGLLGAAFDRSTLSRPISVFTAGSTLGKSVALLASGAILTFDLATPALHRVVGGGPWRMVFVVTALPNLLLLLTFLFVRLPDRQTTHESGVDETAKGRGLLDLAFLTYSFLALTPIILIQALAAWTPLFYGRYFHFPPAQAAVLLGTVVLIAAPLGHLMGGQLTAMVLKRGVGPAVLVTACLCLSIPLGLVFCFAPVSNLSLGAYSLLVIALGVSAPAGLTGISLLAPPGRLGSFNAVYMGLATLVGVGLGPTLVGAMSDLLFGGAAGLRQSLCTLLLAVPVTGALLSLACLGLWRRNGLALSNGQADGAFGQHA
jgi:MFS family permease